MYKMTQKAEFKKALRRIDRLRIKSEKKHIEGLEYLKKHDVNEFNIRLNISQEFQDLKDLNVYLWRCELAENDELSKLIYNDSYLGKSYSVSEVAHVIKHAAEYNDYKYDDNFVEKFEQTIFGQRGLLNKHALVPITFLSDSMFSFFSKAKNTDDFPERIQLSKEFFLLPSIKNSDSIDRLGLSSESVKEADFRHHEVVSKNALTSSPVLVFDFKATQERERDRIKDKFLWFRGVLDFFILYNRLEVESYYDQSHPTKNHHFCISGDEFNRYPNDFDSSFRLAYDTNVFDSINGDDFFSYTLGIYENTECKVRNKLYNSLHFFSKAFRENDNIDKFLNYIISIEALCSIVSSNITSNLSGFMIGESFNEYDDVKLQKAMLSSYALRSKIVHHGHSFVSSYDTKVAEILALTSIRKAIRIYRSLSMDGGSVDWPDWVRNIAR